MAARKPITTPAGISLDSVSAYLRERKAVDRNSQIPIGEAAAHFKIAVPDFIELLDKKLDPNSEIIDGDPGKLCLAKSAPAPVQPVKRGPGRPPKAVTEAPKPAAPTAPVQPVVAAVTPVLDSTGAPVTIPVDFDNPEAGRRELDASKGERVLSEDNMRNLIQGSPKSEEPNVSGKWTAPVVETHFIEFDRAKIGTPQEGHMLLPDVEFMDAPPEGVTPHFWELAQSANTIPARIFWGNKVAEEMKAHALAILEREKSEESAEPEVRQAPINPLTGKPFDF